MREGKQHASSSSSCAGEDRDDELALAVPMEQDPRDDAVAARIEREQRDEALALAIRMEEEHRHREELTGLLLRLDSLEGQHSPHLAEVLGLVSHRPRARCKASLSGKVVLGLREALSDSSERGTYGTGARPKRSPAELTADAELRATIRTLKSAGHAMSPAVLAETLRCPACSLSADSSSVASSKAGVESRLLAGEKVLFGWAVDSFNEWGRADSRVLVLTSLALYRCKEDSMSGEVTVCARTGLADICNLTFCGAAGTFEISTQQRDGRSNPLNLAWGELKKQYSASSGSAPAAAPVAPRFARSYAAAVPVGIDGALASELLCEAVAAAQRLHLGSELSAERP